MVELTKLKKDEESQIVELKGGKDFHSRMASLGITKGAAIKVLQNYGKGPIIVIVRNTRIALGRGEANKILVDKNE
jgi:ferrous iron transport protein A